MSDHIIRSDQREKQARESSEDAITYQVSFVTLKFVPNFCSPTNVYSVDLNVHIVNVAKDLVQCSLYSGLVGG